MILQPAQHKRVGGNDAGSSVRPPWQLVQNPVMPNHHKALTNNEFGAFDERLLSYEQRAALAQGKAAQAFGRLLNLAEPRDSGQARSIAHFIAATYNGAAFTFDLFDMRMLDVQISDDMLAALDALRWGKADLFRLVPEGEKRVLTVLALWGIQPASQP